MKRIIILFLGISFYLISVDTTYAKVKTFASFTTGYRMFLGVANYIAPSEAKDITLQTPILLSHATTINMSANIGAFYLSLFYSPPTFSTSPVKFTDLSKLNGIDTMVKLNHAFAGTLGAGYTFGNILQFSFGIGPSVLLYWYTYKEKYKNDMTSTNTTPPEEMIGTINTRNTEKINISIGGETSIHISIFFTRRFGITLGGSLGMYYKIKKNTDDNYDTTSGISLAKDFFIITNSVTLGFAFR